jgi:hypothetical protein
MIIGLIVLLGAGVWWASSMRSGGGLATRGEISARIDGMLGAMQTLSAPPPYDKTGDRLFSVKSWSITSLEAQGSRAQAVVHIESTNKGGAPIAVNWLMDWTNYPGQGWTCTKLTNPNDL